MWIRSQNKEVLADIKAFDTTKNKAKFCITGYLNSISDKCLSLGNYETKEKAISVLDDLQCRIAKTESGIFQMPGDGSGFNIKQHAKKLDKALDKACELISNYSGSCPFDMFDKDISCQESCTNDARKCWREYLLKGDKDNE